jgi:hypothetical protein
VYALIPLVLALVFVILRACRPTTAGWAGTAAAVSAVVAIVLAFVNLLTPVELPPIGPSPDLEKLYVQAKMEMLGRYLKDHLADRGPILLIHHMVQKDNEGSVRRHEALVSALEKGLAGSITIDRRVSLDLDPRDPKTRPKPGDPMPWGVVTAKIFDEWIQANSQCGVVVSLVGVPYNYRDSAHWKGTGRKVALVLTDWPYGQVAAIRSGLIAAVVLARPDYRLDLTKSSLDDVSKDAAALFRPRWVIVDSRNIDEICRRYPEFVRVGEEE